MQQYSEDVLYHWAQAGSWRSGGESERRWSRKAVDEGEGEGEARAGGPLAGGRFWMFGIRTFCSDDCTREGELTGASSSLRLGRFEVTRFLAPVSLALELLPFCAHISTVRLPGSPLV
jgi:hypothetical protein